jgi:indoleamine 2,3-dioxygenase
LGRPPVLSYSSYALHNWRRMNPKGPIALGNICLLQNFHGGLDEEWFILVHIEIEAKAAPALSSLLSAQDGVRKKDRAAVERHLATIVSSLEAICETLDRMPENCDPTIYYNRVRPYIHGWKDNPGLPKGLVYEGVAAYGGEPQRFRGETGAQSSIIPSLDEALGIRHMADPLRPYLMEMREYMPPDHRRFIATIEQGPSIRDFLIKHHKDRPSLRETYNHCVQLIGRFRTTHLEYAARYIQKQSQQRTSNPTEVGTGGTPFLVYLKKHKEETLTHMI